MTDLSFEIGQAIKAARKAARMSQAELAHRLGKTLRTVQKYESGEILPSIPTILQIANELDAQLFIIILTMSIRRLSTMSNAVSINNSVLMGRLTRDPELKYVSGNIPICSFRLAVARHTSGDEEKTDFIPCVAWREKAEFVSQWFSKGTLAIVIGELISHVWKDEQGKSHLTIEVKCNEVTFGETKRQRMAREEAGQLSNATGSLQITATDVSSGEVLSGAVYDLYDYDGNTVKQNILSSSDSAAHIVGLPAGEYIITEVTVPQGYEPAARSTSAKVEVGMDTSITMPHRPMPYTPQQPIEAIPQGILPEGLMDDDTDCPY